jgi:hypothetical protein
MIVSHRHRFIFIKTAKTAGSSVERALKPFCGPDDVFTGAGPLSESANVKRGLRSLGLYVPGEIRRRFPQISGFYAHMPARQVRSLVGPEVWNTYFKFSIERNPWDRQVSLFHYRHIDRERGEFESYLTSPFSRLFHNVRIDNWEMYTIGGEIAVDHVLRYENIASEFTALCVRLGVGDDVALPEVNVRRPKERGVYRHYYTDRTREIVARWYRNEIAAFDYQF